MPPTDHDWAHEFAQLCKDWVLADSNAHPATVKDVAEKHQKVSELFR